MAQRTISAAGGNWNSTATWVEGAVPTSSDFVVGDASSGQLTINVGANAQYVDFTNYTQTLTMLTYLQLALANATNIIGAGMTIVGTGSFNFYNTNGTLIQYGTNRIPVLATANTSKNYSGNIYVVNLTHQNTQTHNGGNVYISGNYTSAADNGGTTKFIMDGTGNLNAGGISTETIVNTTGTITVPSNTSIIIGGQKTNITTSIFRHQAGTIVNPRIASSLNGGTNLHTIDLISGTTWDISLLTNLGTPASPSKIVFSGTADIDNLVFSTPITNNLTGNGIEVSGVDITTNNLQIINSVNLLNNVYGVGDMTLYLGDNQTITVDNEFVCNGGINYGGTQTPNTIIRSITPSTTTNLNINTYNQYVSSTQFTDVDCSGGNTLYGQNLTLSNTTNITEYSLPVSAGGGETSYTFVN